MPGKKCKDAAAARKCQAFPTRKQCNEKEKKTFCSLRDRLHIFFSLRLLRLRLVLNGNWKLDLRLLVIVEKLVFFGPPNRGRTLNNLPRKSNNTCRRRPTTILSRRCTRKSHVAKKTTTWFGGYTEKKKNKKMGNCEVFLHGNGRRFLGNPARFFQCYGIRTWHRLTQMLSQPKAKKRSQFPKSGKRKKSLLQQWF